MLLLLLLLLGEAEVPLSPSKLWRALRRPQPLVVVVVVRPSATVAPVWLGASFTTVELPVMVRACPGHSRVALHPLLPAIGMEPVQAFLRAA